MSESTTLTDHDEIRAWAEDRGGRPARVAATADNDEGGVLRFDFGEPEDRLEEIPWEQFFEIFEERKLALLCGTAAESRFSKFIRRGSS